MPVLSFDDAQSVRSGLSTLQKSKLSNDSVFQLLTRSGKNYAFHAPLVVHVGQSLDEAIKDAFERDEAGFQSPPSSPRPSCTSSHLTPPSDADSMDVPRDILFPPPPPIESPLTGVHGEPPPPIDVPQAADADSDHGAVDPPNDMGWESEGACASEYGSSLSCTGASEYASELEADAAPPSLDTPPLLSKKRRRNWAASDKHAKKGRLQRKRKAHAEARGPTTMRAPTYREAPTALRTQIKSESTTLACSTGFTGLRSGALKPRTVWTLPQLRKEGHRVLEWDGEKPVVLLDDKNQIVAVLVGKPLAKPGKLNDWGQVISGLEKAIAELQESCTLQQGDKIHRRGPHPAKAFGVSHGGGQTHPKVLDLNTAANEAAFEKFSKNPSVKRVAGFGSSAFSYYGPKMFARYCGYFSRLRANNAALVWPFDNSVFPTTTVNFGPNATCYDHLDYANAAAGWCSITSAGSYDPRHGGHLILFDIKTVVQFPPGATILIPSSVWRHGNTPIQPGETRVGMTQYAAGGLFRWVDNGFMRAKDTSEEAQARMRAEAPTRFNSLLKLYSTLESLVSDRISVFGK
ncbi:hypothetical protein HWV62_17434 [Athelia sp. TMB]|nr:hypothetical protein HWV62_17434 [Athelia sp. TMB]